MFRIMQMSICFIFVGLCCTTALPFEIPDCPENLVYEACGSDYACDRTCDKPHPRTCNRKCVSRCECPSDKPIIHNGRCVTQSECTSERTPVVKPTQATTTLRHYFQCPETQEFQQCGSACNRTCADGEGPVSCNKVCEVRCGCPAKRPYWHEEKCIAYEKCPKDKGTARDIGKDSANDAKAKRKIYDLALDKLIAVLTSLGIKTTDGR